MPLVPKSNKTYTIRASYDRTAVKDFASGEVRSMLSPVLPTTRERNDGARAEEILHRRDYKLHVSLMRSTRGLRPNDFLLPFSLLLIHRRRNY